MQTVETKRVLKSLGEVTSSSNRVYPLEIKHRVCSLDKKVESLWFGDLFMWCGAQKDDI